MPCHIGARGPRQLALNTSASQLVAMSEAECGIFLCLAARSVIRRDAAGSRDILIGVCRDGTRGNGFLCHPSWVCAHQL